MRESVDDGLADLQKKGGTGGLPATPACRHWCAVKAAFAADAPPPDASAQAQIAQQAAQADSAEQEAVAGLQPTPASSRSGGSATITVGQSPEEVSAILGNPSRIVDLGAKKIYSYPDMKIYFQNGRVTDVN